MTDADDPIAFELFRNAIFSIADEMALTIFRMTCPGVLKDNMDYSTAFCDADGKLVAQGLTPPGHLGAMPTALEVVVASYHDDMAPGDVLALNDPFEGGLHLPDIFVLKPLYFEGEGIASAEAICHHTDVGGRVAGSSSRRRAGVPASSRRTMLPAGVPPGAQASRNAYGSILIEL